MSFEGNTSGSDRCESYKQEEPSNSCSSSNMDMRNNSSSTVDQLPSVVDDPILTLGIDDNVELDTSASFSDEEHLPQNLSEAREVGSNSNAEEEETEKEEKERNSSDISLSNPFHHHRLPILWRNIFAVILLSMVTTNSEPSSKLTPCQSPSASSVTSTSKDHVMDCETSSSSFGTAPIIMAEAASTSVKTSTPKTGPTRKGNDNPQQQQFNMLQNDVDEDFVEYDDDYNPMDTNNAAAAESSGKELERYMSGWSQDGSSQEDDVIVIATMDGAFVGIQRSTGETLWKQHPQQRKKSSSSSKLHPNRQQQFRQEQYSTPTKDAIFAPLTSTSTTSSSSSQKTSAIPSIDGRVYLSPPQPQERQRHRHHYVHRYHNKPSSSSSDLTVVTSMKELVSRSPFVDAGGKIIVGVRKSYAMSLDRDTGEVLRLIDGNNYQSSENESDDEFLESVLQEEEEGDGDNGNSNNSPTQEKRIMWVGRVDYSVSIYDGNTGDTEVEFSTSEVLSIEDMLDHEDEDHDDNNEDHNVGGGRHGRNQEEEYYRHHPTLMLPSGREQQNQKQSGMEQKIMDLRQQHGEFGSSSISLQDQKSLLSSVSNNNNQRDTTKQSSASIAATPGGKLAMRDLNSGEVLWVSKETFDAPVAFALESRYGSSLGIDIIPDAPMPEAFSKEYLEENWIDDGNRATSSGHTNKNSNDRNGRHSFGGGVGSIGGNTGRREGRGRFGTGGIIGTDEQVYDSETVVGSLGTGELFVLPLGRRGSNYNNLQGLPHTPTYSSTAISKDRRDLPKIPKDYQVDWNHESNHDDEKSIGAYTAFGVHNCDPSSNSYHKCLYEASFSSWLDYTFPDQYNPELFLPPPGNGKGNDKPRSHFQTFLSVMVSWIPPAVALVFVVSFEMGRRGRMMVESMDTNNQEVGDGTSNDNGTSASSSSDALTDSLDGNDRQVGVIQVSDEVLGFGGHGTVVYKGMLDGRSVAVKRMLKAYHASAEREISLLIESDGHPNVVRYFLKETKGDFVYLALELCDMNLQDLIIALAKKRMRMALHQQSSEEGTHNNFSQTSWVLEATRKALFGIAQGVKHIHSLRIVHRDLKPQNILLQHARINRRNSSSDSTSGDDVYQSFQEGAYVPKISDMGLGKQLAGQSSFGLSTLNNSLGVGGGHDASSTIAGPGPGSVGWQAPEVMAQRLSADSTSSYCSPVLTEASPVEASLNGRTSRSVDIFSLGCIFYCTFLPGSHPFGEWWERESNIMKNCPSIKELEEISCEAADLVRSMINRKPSARPNASQVCNHPFFWSATKRLAFLCDLSDRLEADAENQSNSGALDILLIEQQATNIVGTAWDTKLDGRFFNSVTRFRTYDESSVRDFLRLIRNKNNHFDELSQELKESIASNQEELLMYFESKFPRLLMHCYDICREHLLIDDKLSKKYDIPSKRNPANKETVKESKKKVSNSQSLENNSLPSLKQSTEMAKESAESRNKIEKQEKAVLTDHPPILTPMPQSSKEGNELKIREDISDEIYEEDSGRVCRPTDDLVVWEGSSIASTLGCRGWIRSEDEWLRRTSKKSKKVDPNIIRNSKDPIFRTRLCNHWDQNQGTFCSMRKKNKCVFAHGPVELRVKAGKRNRWGKLVDKNGNNSNPFHSGGEDTYGAARSIEATRKEEGKWKTQNKTPGKKGKNRGKQGNKKTNS